MAIEKWLRSFAYQLVLLRDGRHGVMKYMKDFAAFARKPSGELMSFSFDRLKEILMHAGDNSPYYHSMFADVGFNSRKMDGVEDLHRLPFISKSIIENYKQEMIARNYPRESLEISHTGGTTGTHVSFYRDRNCTSLRMGRQLGVLALCGYEPGDRSGLIWGSTEDMEDYGAKQSLKKRFRKFASSKEELPCAILTENKMIEYYRRLRQFKPAVMYGYPNAMSHFARFIYDNHLEPIRVGKIFCTAERLTNSQRAMMQDIFGGEVYNLYCTREHGCIGFECNRHNGFHIDIGSVHIEILADGKPVPTGNIGEIVITDLWNYGMPFIRNRISDLGSISMDKCDCGCELPLLRSLDGRVADTVYRPDGTKVDALSLVDMFYDLKVIKAQQIVQERLEELDFYLVVTDDYNKETEERVLSEIRELMGKESKININLTKEIPRHPVSGKYQEVICKIQAPIFPKENES
jgi:phenylacetate-CoA ligase